MQPYDLTVTRRYLVTAESEEAARRILSWKVGDAGFEEDRHTKAYGTFSLKTFPGGIESCCVAVLNPERIYEKKEQKIDSIED